MDRGKKGTKISPGNSYNDITEHDTHQVYPALLAALAPLNLVYLHVIHAGDEDLVARLRREWPTALLLNRAGAPLEARIADLDAGLADVVTVAAAALANPDLAARLQANAPLNAADPHAPAPTQHRLDEVGDLCPPCAGLPGDRQREGGASCSPPRAGVIHKHERSTCDPMWD
ncbi:hypothetical protein [Streptomyces sp. PSAA01]|uniref:hypothetical protein n=1 Tax=Streptomyces sp. PSAA01 TaxID=2912762 RepID=UPI001F19C775|nr:hypothetical protein [Streptomyces sp. PSAA01]MCG0284587.1 hypothetical protein [Streptomyces sp. PSAA01]